MFTKGQVEVLKTNENVSNCSEKSITFTASFKSEAVRQYLEADLGSREIFERSGFDLEILGKARPKACLTRWRKSFRVKGARRLTETRGLHSSGRRPEPKDATPTDKIKRLEAEVEYLKAENSFLAKLRAKRAE